MKVCVFGVGAVGGVIAAHLINAGVDVCVVGRGASLAAIKEHGIRLSQTALDGSESTITAKPRRCIESSDTPSLNEEFDLVLLCVKAHHTTAALPSLLPLLSSKKTILLPLQNGIPFWFLRGHPTFDSHILQSIDPGGRLSSSIPLAQCIGGVIYVSATNGKLPGEVFHVQGRDLIILGEPSGENSARLVAVESILQKSSLTIKCSSKIREDYFHKLWGNAAMNPISALTCATMGMVVDDPRTFALLKSAMGEAQAVAEALNIRWCTTFEQRVAMIKQLSSHKTSMLQDIEAGREAEVGPLVEVIGELGRLLNVPTPINDTLVALISQRSQTAIQQRK